MNGKMFLGIAAVMLGTALTSTSADAGLFSRLHQQRQGSVVCCPPVICCPQVVHYKAVVRYKIASCCRPVVCCPPVVCCKPIVCCEPVCCH